jgi:uncharacterized protein YdeI (YjbR/CyaY-like superfamily)
VLRPERRRGRVRLRDRRVRLTYFTEAAALRRWFAAHPDADELWVGFHKKASGKPSVTYQEAVDEALCVGWIDGVRKGGETTWSIRFTPRRPRSIWSAVNLRRAKELIAAGRMRPAGLAAYQTRDEKRANLYSFEQKTAELTPAQQAQFRKNKRAWAFWERQPPGYRKTASWLVISAKKDETKARRLATLIAHSAKGERLPQLTSPTKR